MVINCWDVGYLYGRVYMTRRFGYYRIELEDKYEGIGYLIFCDEYVRNGEGGGMWS